MTLKVGDCIAVPEIIDAVSEMPGETIVRTLLGDRWYLAKEVAPIQ